MQPGQVFESPRGTRIVVRENSPERISFERTMPRGTGAGSKSRHYHTDTHESFELLSGEATAWVDGTERPLQHGEVFEVPLHSPHSNPRTAGDGGATIVQSVAPRPRAVEVYFASWIHWLTEGKTLDTDEPTTLQLAAITKEGGFGGTWIAGVPVLLQRLGLPVLGLVARARGVRAVRVPPG